MTQPSFARSGLASSLVLASLLGATSAFAQDAAADPPAQREAERPAEAAPADDMKPREENHEDARPEPPGGVVDTNELDGPHPVVKGAGMGSDIAYAERGVVEVGGTIGLDVRNELFDLTVAPTIGYFIIDRLELSLIPLLRIRSLDDDGDGVSETNVRFAGILEPSYHLPFSDVLYGFVGVGLGITVEEGPGADFLLRPVAGLDIMVGRSGIFKPAGFIDVGVGNGAIGGGAQGAFTVMF